MNHALTPATVFLLAIPPLLWAGNAVVGRMVNELVPPVTLNFLRWLLALLILLPFAPTVFRHGSGLLRDWRQLAVLGLLGVGIYNALQYLALQSSTPINVTLVGASMPVWMLLVGSLFFGARVSAKQVAGAVLSMAGVLLVLARGNWELLVTLRLVPGDLYMVLATISWSFYSWLLSRSTVSPAIRSTWASFLLAQVFYGSLWAGMFTAAEWTLTEARIQWGWPLAAALLFVAVGPAVIAYRFWGAGVLRVGPSTASFFVNLTPLFAALLSLAFLGELPQAYHAAAFALIVGGIVLSSRR